MVLNGNIYKNNLEKMYSYNGTTNIEVVGNLPMIMKVSALKGE